MNTILDTKTCTRCGKEKELNHFSNNDRMADGKASWCKKCESEHSNKFYHRKMSEINFYRLMSPVTFF